jgi:tRNA(Arg) A34 adenosine deaminase TadA
MSTSDVSVSLATSRRAFLRSASLAATVSLLTDGQFALAGPQATAGTASQSAQAFDAKRMRDLAAWTALTMKTPYPVPFGSEIVHTKTGESLMRAANSVAKDNDPSAHAELRTIRLACAKLGSYSLKGYTLYTTCEPCVMCMGCILFSGIDRVVFGATMADAAHFGHEIFFNAAEVAKRSDLKCIVDGPVERDACYALFTNPAMQKAFKPWNSDKP